jgi:hypothetical protein
MTEYDLYTRELREIFSIIAWCGANFGVYTEDKIGRWVAGRWYYDSNRFKIKFAYEADAIMFALRWL